ncbi:1279_t:CDS:2 [Paraglomus brasilianum]|uniref:1279_t:CDS:1 n=1 Tax=Paraglomus brasilianum TaxID=144538 RepID=A0A9N9DUX4_9GLOM|nr:1279_t:CDS:2 [Paraglomus brasilianum]
MPEVGIYPSQEVNAFATGPAGNTLIAFSSGLINIMSLEEIRGVYNNQEQEKTIRELEKSIKNINQELKIPEKTDDPKPTKNPPPEKKDNPKEPNDKSPSDTPDDKKVPEPDPQPDNNKG